MKANGEGLLQCKAFKVQLMKVVYFYQKEMAMDFTKPKSERKYEETGNLLYFMKCDVRECKQGFGKSYFMPAQFEITKEEYESKAYEKGDKLQIFENATFTVDNFTLRDTRPENLKLVEKKYHKVMTTKSGEQIPYTDNRICNVKLCCKQGQYKLIEKKNNKYYFLIEGIKFEVIEAEKDERLFTYYINDEIYEQIKHLHGKNKLRIELWDSVKRKKIHTGRIECGIYEGERFFSLHITTDTAEVLKEKREQKKREKEEAKRKEEEKARKLAEEQAERERLEQERLAEIKRQKEEAERIRRECEEKERQKRLRQLEIENKRQYIMRPDIED